jgi:4-amino-4-deoxy-L-arabinose transferase-like glycosyltransferase
MPPTSDGRRAEGTPAAPHAAVRRHRWIVPVGVLTLATHGFAYFFFHYSLSNDAREYLTLGVRLAESGELVLPGRERAKRMPLYPAFVAVVYRWQGGESLDNAIFEMQTVLAIASVMLLAAVAARLAGDRAAVVAGFVAALYAPFRYLQMIPLTETLVIFLLLLAVLMYLLSFDARRTAAVCALTAAASLALGLCLLTRADALLFVPAFAADAALRRLPSRRRLLRVTCMALPALAIAGGWMLRNHQLVGRAALSTIGGLNFYLGHNPNYAAHPGMDDADYGAFDRLRAAGLTEAEADRRLYADGRRFAAEHPRETFVNALRKTKVWLWTSVAWCPPTTLLILAAALGSALSARGSRPAAPAASGTPAILMSVALGLVIVVWLYLLIRSRRPWTHPAWVVPLGLVALGVCWRRMQIGGLIALLVASQWIVAVVFIPLERLRWTIDGLLIVALAVGVSRLGDRLTLGIAETKNRPDDAPAA